MCKHDLYTDGNKARDLDPGGHRVYFPQDDTSQESQRSRHQKEIRQGVEGKNYKEGEF